MGLFDDYFSNPNNGFENYFNTEYTGQSPDFSGVNQFDPVTITGQRIPLDQYNFGEVAQYDPQLGNVDLSQSPNASGDGYGPPSSSAGGFLPFLEQGANFLKNNPTLTQLGGAALGALASKDSSKTNTETKDPWGPAQPYLIDNLKTNANAQEHYRANPFSAEQKAAYQNVYNTLANSNANVPGLLANAANFSKSNRGSMPAMQGLLSNTQAPLIDWNQYSGIGRK